MADRTSYETVGAHGRSEDEDQVSIDERPVEAPAPTFDPEALRERYRHERDKRLRPDGNSQYVEIAGAYAGYLHDPYVEASPREPRRDDVEVALV